MSEEDDDVMTPEEEARYNERWRKFAGYSERYWWNSPLGQFIIVFCGWVDPGETLLWELWVKESIEDELAEELGKFPDPEAAAVVVCQHRTGYEPWDKFCKDEKAPDLNQWFT